MDEKDAYQNKLEGKLEEWKADIDKLKAKADQASAETKIEFDKQVADLRGKQDAAKEKLNEFRQSGDEAWENLKGGLDKTWNELGEAMKTAASKFK